MQLLGLFRRAVAAVGIAAGVAGALRLRGSGGVPPRTGGWREITDEDLAAASRDASDKTPKPQLETEHESS